MNITAYKKSNLIQTFDDTIDKLTEMNTKDLKDWLIRKLPTMINLWELHLMRAVFVSLIDLKFTNHGEIDIHYKRKNNPSADGAFLVSSKNHFNKSLVNLLKNIGILFAQQ